MNDFEDELRKVFRAKEGEAPTVLPLSEYLGGDPARRLRRWQWAAVPAAVTVAAALVVGVVALQPDVSREAPVVAGSSTSDRQGPVVDNQSAGSCVEEYSPKTAMERSFAFDGVVTGIDLGTTNRPDRGPLSLAAVTFEVKEWFVGGSQDTVTVDMVTPSLRGDTESAINQSYSVGTRLLLSGEPRWGGSDPLADAIAWDGCGFVRYWDEQTADQWRAATLDLAASLPRDKCWKTNLVAGVPDYIAPRPVEDTPPVELAATYASALGGPYSDVSYVVAVTSDDTQKILLVIDGEIVGELDYTYGEYGWEVSGLEYCS
ncbi:MAG: hypothetical protein ABI720_00640 [Actinomycetes bacterium]